MTDTRLIFRAPRDNKRSFAEVANAVSRAIGATVETYEMEELEGNPHDSYVGRASIRAQTASVRLDGEVMQYASTVTSDRQNGDVFLDVVAPAETRQRLRDAFASIGYDVES